MSTTHSATERRLMCSSCQTSTALLFDDNCERCHLHDRIAELEAQLEEARVLLTPIPTEADEGGETRFKTRAWRDRRDVFLAKTGGR